MHRREMVKSSKYWHFGLNPTPLIDQKCTYDKVPKNLGRAPPPSFGQNPKEHQFFLRIPSQSSDGGMSYFWLKGKL